MRLPMPPFINVSSACARVRHAGSIRSRAAIAPRASSAEPVCPAAEAMVIGHARKYLVALVEIDYDTVSDWARRTNVAYAGFTSLALHDAVRSLIGLLVAG